MLLDKISFQIQFDHFCAHLSQDYLAGMIISSKKAKNVLIKRDSDFKLKDDENLYFVPQQCDSYSKSDCVKKITTLFLDVDEVKGKIEFPIFANINIERTDSRAFQAFWFLDFEITPEEFKKYQLILANKYGGDTSITNSNRLARVAGFKRGSKKKDEKGEIAKDQQYKIYSTNELKLSRQDLEKLLEQPVSLEKYNKETGEVYEQVEKKISSISELEEEKRDFFVEEGVFYSYFNNINKGDGTSKALFRFACYLLDKSINLKEFENYCCDNGINCYGVSQCDVQEWSQINTNAKKYAKNQKKKEEKAEAQAQKEPIQSVSTDELFEEFPFLHLAMSDIHNYYFVEDEDKFFRLEANNKLVPITKSIFASTFSKYFLKQSKSGKWKGHNPVDVILSRDNQKHFNIVSTKEYMPHTALIDGRSLNIWSYPVLSSATGGSIEVFLNHVKFLFQGQQTLTGEDVGELFLDFLAYAYLSKTPATYAYILYAEKMGVGRSFFTNVFSKLMGDNVSTPTDRVVKEHYTGWHSTKQLAIIEELGEDRTFFDQLKPIIGNAKVSHRQMGKDASTVDNHCSILMLTNKIKALNIAKGDRRIAVVHMYQDVREPAYYTEIYGWVENPKNIAALAEFFKQRFLTLDVQKMKGHAPVTDAKILVQRLTTDTETQNIEECLEELEFGDNNEFVCQRMLIDRLYPNMTDAVVRYRGLVSNRLQNLNYSPLVVGKRVRFGNEVKAMTIYVKTSFATKHSKDPTFAKVIEQYKDFVENGKQVDKTGVGVVEPIVREVTEIQEDYKNSKLHALIERLKVEQEEKQKQVDAQIIEKVEEIVDLIVPPIVPKKPKKEAAKKVHPLVEQARENARIEKETGVKFKKSATCTDLIEEREKFKSKKIDISHLK